ncbi:molecular chaperone [Serratia sp. UGAL515B_01]|uniref:fimbrial biogenesis chaperone n=1 Tax=Serratia sp. UGAL515B_01 TaxID=2986763 RepID=UPI002954ADBD|nr:fimbria/pilus periplasmic chaperone [Serratia sp. UGAL515B_01]WON78906.1 fimbria/pilus periplasmic chaperone [Serratia sp. UGAL515B_01]
MQKIRALTLGFTLFFSAHAVEAAIALDRTRVIYDGEVKSVSLNITNENKQQPYLAQAWIEDAENKKITGPLVVVPPVQRLEAGAKSILRITSLPAASSLPQDRESLFYFNLREIPPRSEKPNVMQIALQTKIKLFYRPAAITPERGAVWQEQLQLIKTATGYRIENPTPYFITVIDLTEKGKPNSNIEPVMIAPKSAESVKTPSLQTPVLTYINDYGGRPELTFNCQGERCQTIKS